MKQLIDRIAEWLDGLFPDAAPQPIPIRVKDRRRR